LIICGLDFETTGIQPTASVTEVGLVLWDTSILAPVRMAGYLVDPGEGAVWEPETQEINKINPSLCAEYGTESLRALKQTLLWIQQADVVCAHNGRNFDRLVLKRWAEKYGLDWFPDKLWIDTTQDLEVTAHSSKRLNYMAADNGLLNPFPHRALFDVMTMLKILGFYPLDKVIEAARTPNIAVKIVHVPFEKKDWPKAHGFHAYYDKKKDKFQFWVKVFKENKFEEEFEEVKEAGFVLEKLPAIPEGVY